MLVTAASGFVRGARVVPKVGVDVFGKQHEGVRRKLTPPPKSVVSRRTFTEIIW